MIICWVAVSLTWRRALSALVVMVQIVGVPRDRRAGRFSNVEVYQPATCRTLFAVFLLMLPGSLPARANALRAARGGVRRPGPPALQPRWPCGHGRMAALWAITNARARHLVIEALRVRAHLLAAPHRPGDAKPERGQHGTVLANATVAAQ